MDSMNNNVQRLLLNKINLAYDTIKLDQDSRNNILAKYELLAGYMLKASDSSVLVDNLDSYSILLNRVLFRSIFLDGNNTYTRYSNLSKVLTSIDRSLGQERGSKSFKELQKQMQLTLEKHGGSINDDVSNGIVMEALKTFGLQQIEETDNIDDDTFADELDAPDMGDLFDDESIEGANVTGGNIKVAAAKALIDNGLAQDNNYDNYNDKCKVLYDKIVQGLYEYIAYNPNASEEELIDKATDIISEELIGEYGIDEDDGIDIGDIEVESDDSDNVDGDIDIDNEYTAEDKKKMAYIDAVRKVYEGDEGSGTPLRAVLDGLMASIRDLYGSCYSGITKPDGILTDKGILSLDKYGTQYKYVYNHADCKATDDDYTNPEVVKYNSNKGAYGQRYKAIMYAIGVAGFGAPSLKTGMSKEQHQECIEHAVQLAENAFGVAADTRKGLLPTFNDTAKMQYYPRFHTELMTGNYTKSKEFSEWVSSEKNIHKNSYRVTNIDDMLRYARKVIGNCLTQALIDNNIKLEDVGTNDSEVMAVCGAMSSLLKNIIVITNIKKSHFTIKVCSNNTINPERLKEALDSYYKAGSGSSSFKSILKNSGAETNVIELDIVMDDEKYNASSAMSCDIIDDIIETGNIPRWDNVILGEKNDGTPLTFNFKKYGSVSIYGASGSGKGIMTSAVLASAMADGCEIFYFDGKPDNGAALGKIAWDKGVEAPCFNGLFGGSDTFQDSLEDYTHGLRDNSIRESGILDIPDLDKQGWPFQSKNGVEARKLLYEVTITLNAFQFVHNMILKRALDTNIEKLPNGEKRWAVFVIDEIQDAANSEKLIRNRMKEYMDIVGEEEVYVTVTDAKGNVTQKKDGKIKDPKNWEKDTGYLFCKQWLAWADGRCPSWEQIVTKTLRNSSSTLITIFQSNEMFLQNDRGSGKTKIGQLMLKVSQKTVRIAGKNGVVSANAWGDDSNYAWSDEVNSHAKWVISSGEGNLTDKSTVFKPFKVFTTDLGDKVRVMPDDYGAGADNCYSCKEEKEANISGKSTPKGLQAYIIYLFNSLSQEMQLQLENGERLPETLTPEGVLQSSFNYFNSVIPNEPVPCKERNMLQYLYEASPIKYFDPHPSEEARAEMIAADNARESADSELDEYNSSDFGQSQGQPQGQSFSQQSPYTQQANDQMYSAVDEIKKAQEIVRKIQKIMPCNKLIRLNLPQKALEMYFVKFIQRLAYGNKFTYSDRQTKSTNALYGAAIVYSTVAYLDSVDVIDANTVKNTVANTAMGKVAIGLIDCYSNGILQYDQVPDVDLLRQLNSAGQSQQQQVQQSSENQSPFSSTSGDEFNFEDMEDNILNNLKNETGIDPFQSEIDKFEQSGSYEDHVRDNMVYGEYIDNDFPINKPMHTRGENNEIHINNPRPTQNVLRLNESKFISSKTFGPSGIFGKARAKLYENRTGVAYELKQRWEFLLKMIEEYFKNPRLVNSFTFSGNTVVANGIPVNAEPFLDEQYGIMMENIVNFKTLFKKFPFIQKISLDAPTLVEMQMEYGKGMQGVKMMFTMHSSLRTIEIVPFGESTKFKIGRGDLNNQAKINKLNELFEIDDLRAEMETFCAMKNPRLSEKDSGYIDTFYKKSKSGTSALFKKGWEQMMSDKSPNVKQLLKWGTVGALVGVVTFVPAVTAYSAKKGIGKIFGLLKN